MIDFINSGALMRQHMSIKWIALCSFIVFSPQISGASMPWALSYGADKTGQLLYDPKAITIISSNLGIPRSSSEMDGFHGVPSLVNVTSHRYVWSSSCEAHACPYNRGFLWLDTTTGSSIAAHFTWSYSKLQPADENKVLTIGGSYSSANSIPSEAMMSLREWIEVNQLNFDRVYYRTKTSHGHRLIPVDPSQLSEPGK